MGVSAAVFAILVAVTGLLLNHTEDFQLDSRHVQADWVLDWYGIEAPERLVSFPVEGRYVTLMGEHLYLDRREIEGQHRDLVGAVALSEIIVVAVSGSIVLLTARGELIERLQGKDGVPAGMKRIGKDAEGRVIVEGGHDFYRSDTDFLRWEKARPDAASVRWSSPGTPGPQLKTALHRHFRGEVLPVERVLLDLHSGRFFGRYGPWVIDAAALLITLLALSGVWIWLRRRR
ncbi:MAG: PepSY domain-containing protein [Gammaproteobacteria bacterium]|jgi:hypothetical protein